jgi:hypothetical protein
MKCKRTTERKVRRKLHSVNRNHSAVEQSRILDLLEPSHWILPKAGEWCGEQQHHEYQNESCPRPETIQYWRSPRTNLLEPVRTYRLHHFLTESDRRCKQPYHITQNRSGIHMEHSTVACHESFIIVAITDFQNVRHDVIRCERNCSPTHPARRDGEGSSRATLLRNARDLSMNWRHPTVAEKTRGLWTVIGSHRDARWNMWSMTANGCKMSISCRISTAGNQCSGRVSERPCDGLRLQGLRTPVTDRYNCASSSFSTNIHGAQTMLHRQSGMSLKQPKMPFQ